MSLTSTRPAPLMTRLNTEWTTLIAEKEHQFGSLGTATSAAILKRIRASKNTAQDAVLYELVTLAHGGDRTAERVLLQALIPAAQRMAHRVRSLDDFDRHDRVGYAIGAAWESIQRYKLHLRGRVMANLTMNMLGILAPEKSANDRIIADRTTPVATDVLEAEAGAWVTPEPTPEERLAELFTCALDNNLVTTEEVALLSRTALSDEKHAAIAEDLGLSIACLRKRADRIRARIAGAVRDGL